MLISLYSLLLAGSLVLAAPWWLWRMLTSHRYRAGLLQRLGRVPPALRTAARDRPVIWLHAVSVGEFLAAQRLIADLQTNLPTHLIAISTTTATAQQLARNRFPPQQVILSEGWRQPAAVEESRGSTPATGANPSSTEKPGLPIFYFPLDFAFAIRPYLHALQPRLVILMESELWPRLLHECAAARIPVAIANARVSDRSFRRTYPFRSIWLRMARHATLFLAQSQETATRLENLGIPPTRIQTPGNLKYDLALTPKGQVAARIQLLFAGRKIVVAGSTLEGEEDIIFQAWGEVLKSDPEAVLVIAPRHPQRFREVEKLHWDTAFHFQFRAASSEEFYEDPTIEGGCIILLDTLGDLARVYSLASVAFIGGSLVPRGGHNPLEAARFAVPILMGPSYENFREIVDNMIAADAIRITTPEALAQNLTELLQNDHGLGLRAQTFFHSQSGATARTLAALLPLLKAGSK